VKIQIQIVHKKGVKEAIARMERSNNCKGKSRKKKKRKDGKDKSRKKKKRKDGKDNGNFLVFFVFLGVNGQKHSRYYKKG